MPAGGGMTAGTMALIGASASAPIIGGIMGGSSAKKAAAARAAAAQAALAELNKLGLPPDLSKAVVMQQFENQGYYSPELEQEIEMAQSQVAQVKEDEGLRQAQMEVLGSLGDISRGGLRAEDKAAYNQLRAQVQRDSEAKRQQILQQMAARGMAGSGAELITQLQSAQAATDTASEGADRLAAEASQRALAALSQRAQQAGSVRQQDLSVNEMRARALDDRNRFLYENSVSRQRSNLANLNEAQRQNLANKQRLSEMNIQQANTEAQRQNQARRDFFQDKFQLAAAKANAINNQGSAIAQQHQAKADMMSGLGSAIGQGFGAAANYQAANASRPVQSQDDGFVSGMGDLKQFDRY